jgi:hypothetical protein
MGDPRSIGISASGKQTVCYWIYPLKMVDLPIEMVVCHRNSGFTQLQNDYGDVA